MSSAAATPVFPDRIFDHLAEQDHEHAVARIGEIIQAINVVETNPLIGRPALGDKRELIIGRGSRGYVALYRYLVELDTVLVLAIRSQREGGYSTKLGAKSMFGHFRSFAQARRIAPTRTAVSCEGARSMSMSRERVLRWWSITRDAIKLWLDCSPFSHSGALAFFTLFSLAPVVIIAVSVIGLVLGEQAAQGQIVAQLQDVMGRQAAVAVEQAVARSRIQESGLLPTLLGVAALLLAATTVFGQMQASLNTIWGVAARPDRASLFMLVKRRLLSLTVVLAIGFVLLVSLLLGVALRAVLHFAHQFVPAVKALASGSELLLSLAVNSLLFCAIFKVLPDVVLKWREVVIGALVTALLFSIGRYAISAYLAYTATASTYGAAGSVVLILLWVYYSSLILLFGAAFTKAHLLAQGSTVVPRNSAVLVRHELVTDSST